MTWTARFLPNPSDPRPVTFAWSGPVDGGKLTCTDDSMLDAAVRLADTMDAVYATPTGPTLDPDLTVSYLAYQVVAELGRRAGLDEEDVRVEGDGWQWPDLSATSPETTQQPVW